MTRPPSALALLALSMVSSSCGRDAPTAEAPICTPATCAELGTSCGAVADGCGGELDCGTCPAGQSCGAGGVANACGPVAPGCTATTCVASGATCGSISDGCGGTLACGECPEGQTCGGAGTANACGAPVPVAGSVRWKVEGQAIAVDDALHRFVLVSGSSDEHDARVERRRSDGTLVWRASYTVRGWWRESVVVEPTSGAVFLVLYPYCAPTEPCSAGQVITFGAETVTAAAIVKLDPDGRFAWAREATEALWGYATGVGGAGEILVRHGRMTDTGITVTLEKRAADGTLRWTLPRIGETRATLDREGATILIGCDDFGRTWLADAPGLACAEGPEGPSVAKLDADGRPLWNRPVPASKMLAPQVAADGTILFAGMAGAPGTRFGETVLSGGGYVIGALAPDGEPRFATEFSGLAQGGRFPELELAVEPAGAALVAGRDEPPGSDAVLVLIGFDAAGRERFRRTYPEFRIPATAAYGRDLEPFVSSTDHEHLQVSLAIDFAP